MHAHELVLHVSANIKIEAAVPPVRGGTPLSAAGPSSVRLRAPPRS